MTKGRILCVDNSVDDCELLSFVLQDSGYTVEVAQTMAEGVRLAKNKPPDLYLLDVSLQDGTAFDLLGKVRTFSPDTPVIICSADVRDSTQQSAIAAGVQAFLSKPVNLDVLVEKVDQLLS
ncbi:MAG TPA: response regulator [Trichocoleus sp.]